MICRFRPDGTYTFANRAYREAFGLATDASSAAASGGWSPRTSTRPAPSWRRITPASPIATREVSVGTHGGSVHWQQWRDRALFDERGALVEYQAVGRDITDRKRAEDKRRELEAQKSVEAALREADRRKDEFLAMLGHELRNPLAPIGIALEILRTGARPAATTRRGRLESIGRQLSHMTRLIDDLLDISRITRGKIQLQHRVASIWRRVVAQRGRGDPAADRLVRARAGRRTSRRADHGAMPTPSGSRRSSPTCCNNAAKYTERGGRIDVSAGARRRAASQLSVRDNGIGIAAGRARSRLRAVLADARGAQRAQGGLGIGLTLVAAAGRAARRQRRGAQRGPQPRHRDRRAAAAATRSKSRRARRLATGAGRSAVAQVAAHPRGRRQHPDGPGPGARARHVGAHGPHRARRRRRARARQQLRARGRAARPELAGGRRHRGRAPTSSRRPNGHRRCWCRCRDSRRRRRAATAARRASTITSSSRST